MPLWELYPVGQNLHPFYFLNNSVKPRSIVIIFGPQKSLNFLSLAYFTLFVDSRTENQLNILSVCIVAL